MVTIALEDSPPPQPAAETAEVSSSPAATNQQGQAATSMKSSSTHSAATSSDNEEEIPTTLFEQDALVFGTLNRDLTDFLAEKIRHAVQHKVVKELPLLEDEAEAREQLQETLVYKFVRNIDVLENYCEEKVLSLRQFPPAKRKRIVQVMSKGKESLPDIAAPVTSLSDATSSLPTQDMIPSQNDMDTLHQDLQQLQARLEAVRATRNELLVEQHSLNKAEGTIGQVLETLEQHQGTTTSLQKEVQARVTDGNSVQHLTQEAQSYVDKLDEKKKRKQQSQENKTDDDDAQDDDPFFASPVVTKQPRLSLEEAYQRDRKVLLKDSTNNNNDNSNSDAAPLAKLQAVQQMLKPRAAEEEN